MTEQFRKDVSEGLSNLPKSLPSKYLYDQRGDWLFVQIMHMPEYYLTHAELEIFTEQTTNIINALQLSPNTYFELIELGPGDGLKTKELLKTLDIQHYKFDYSPVDISRNALDTLKKKINEELPDVSVKKKQGDYFQVLESLKDSCHPKVVLFLGSNIGNMTDETASSFIYRLGESLNANDKLFLGVDLMKPASIVLPAYDDSQGITKAFNLNLLERINRELGSDFDIDKFSHQPEYSEKEGVAKSFLVSTTDQDVYIDKVDKTFHFEEGEKILTEISRKYDDEVIVNLTENTDFEIVNKLIDSKKYFADYVLNRTIKDNIRAHTPKTA